MAAPAAAAPAPDWGAPWEQVEREAAAHASKHFVLEGQETYGELYERFVEQNYPQYYTRPDRGPSGLDPYQRDRVFISAIIALAQDERVRREHLAHAQSTTGRAMYAFEPDYDYFADLLHEWMWDATSATMYDVRVAAAAQPGFVLGPFYLRPFEGAWDYAWKRIPTPLLRRMIVQVKQYPLPRPGQVHNYINYRAFENKVKLDELEAELARRMAVAELPALMQSGLLNRLIPRDSDAARHLAWHVSPEGVREHDLRLAAGTVRSLRTLTHTHAPAPAPLRPSVVTGNVLVALGQRTRAGQLSSSDLRQALQRMLASLPPLAEPDAKRYKPA